MTWKAPRGLEPNSNKTLCSQARRWTSHKNSAVSKRLYLYLIEHSRKEGDGGGVSRLFRSTHCGQEALHTGLNTQDRSIMRKAELTDCTDYSYGHSS